MLQMYSVYDKKASSYDRPFFVKHVQEAIRSLEQAFKLPQPQQPWFVAYPADYALYLIGSFNPDGGQLYPSAENGPQFVIELSNLAPQTAGPSKMEIHK